jgi:hypothetical protein
MPSYVTLPPMNPLACTNTHPGTPHTPDSSIRCIKVLHSWCWLHNKEPLTAAASSSRAAAAHQEHLDLQDHLPLDSTTHGYSTQYAQQHTVRSTRQIARVLCTK